MSNNKNEEDSFEWADEAIKRLERVPKGFMRNMTKNRVEKYAKEMGTNIVTFEIAENGIAGAKNSMSSMMGGSFPAGAPKKTDEINSDSKNEVSIDKNIDYYFCDICGYTIKGFIPDECPICRAVKEKFKLVTNKEELITASSGRVLDWAPEALERMDKTPEGFMRDMTKWRIEAFVRKSGSLQVTVDLIEKKYKYWGDGSKNITEELNWDDEAKEKINKIPSFVRGMVIKEVENEAKKAGATLVTQDILSKVKNKWNSSMEFHSALQQE